MGDLDGIERWLRYGSQSFTTPGSLVMVSTGEKIAQVELADLLHALRERDQAFIDAAAALGSFFEERRGEPFEAVKEDRDVVWARFYAAYRAWSGNERIVA